MCVTKNSSLILFLQVQLAMGTTLPMTPTSAHFQTTRTLVGLTTQERELVDMQWLTPTCRMVVVVVVEEAVEVI